LKQVPAFFSQEDDADDAGGIKVSVVFGHIGKERPEIVSRLVCLDRFMPLWMNADGGFDVVGRLQ
jgi:PRTRC genetic system protein A